MPDGRMVLHVQCRVCGRWGEVPENEIIARYGRKILAGELRPRLKCSACRAKGYVEMRFAWVAEQLPEIPDTWGALGRGRGGAAADDQDDV